MLPRPETNTHARLRTGDGCRSNPGAWLIAPVGFFTVIFFLKHPSMILTFAAVNHTVMPLSFYIIHDTSF